MAEDSSYQYPQQPSSDDYSKSAFKGGTENVVSILTNRRVLMLLGSILLMVFIFMRHSREPAPKTHTAPPPVQKVDVPKVNTLVIPQAPIPAPTPPKPIDNSHQFFAVNDRLSGLQQGLEQEKRERAEVQEHLASLSSALEQVNSNLASLKEQIQQPKEPEPAQEAPKEAPIPEDIHHYQLMAIIEGRAWVSEAEQTLTVAIDDVLPSYGRVISIDPENGIIETSSGRNIGFFS